MNHSPHTNEKPTVNPPSESISENHDLEDTALRLAHAVRTTRTLLDNASQELPHHITERLRAARVRALATPVQPKPAQSISSRLSHWLGNALVSGWMKGGVVVSSLAFVWLVAHQFTPQTQVPLATATSPSTLNNGSDYPPATNAHPANPTTTATTRTAVVAQALLAPLSRKSPQTTAPLPNIALLHTEPTANHRPQALNADAEIDTILQEKIPLQAYLSDEFDQFAQQKTQATSTHLPTDAPE